MNVLFERSLGYFQSFPGVIACFDFLRFLSLVEIGVGLTLLVPDFFDVTGGTSVWIGGGLG